MSSNSVASVFFKTALGCFGAGVVVIGLGVGCAAIVAVGSGDTDNPAPTSAPSGVETEASAEESPAQEVVEEEVPDVYTAGTYVVGEDIEPGVYRTDGPDESSFSGTCYYARLAGLSGELDDIIANNLSEGPSTVEVLESDTALELTGDCEWELQ